MNFYNTERPGLGYEFAGEVQNTRDRIRTFPEATLVSQSPQMLRPTLPLWSALLGLR
jgi:hypothetical protein